MRPQTNGNAVKIGNERENTAQPKNRRNGMHINGAKHPSRAHVVGHPIPTKNQKFTPTRNQGGQDACNRSPQKRLKNGAPDTMQHSRQSAKRKQNCAKSKSNENNTNKTKC